MLKCAWTFAPRKRPTTSAGERVGPPRRAPCPFGQTVIGVTSTRGGSQRFVSAADDRGAAGWGERQRPEGLTDGRGRGSRCWSGLARERQAPRALRLFRRSSRFGYG